VRPGQAHTTKDRTRDSIGCTTAWWIGSILHARRSFHDIGVLGWLRVKPKVHPSHTGAIPAPGTTLVP